MSPVPLAAASTSTASGFLTQWHHHRARSTSSVIAAAAATASSSSPSTAIVDELRQIALSTTTAVSFVVENWNLILGVPAIVWAIVHLLRVVLAQHRLHQFYQEQHLSACMTSHHGYALPPPYSAMQEDSHPTMTSVNGYHAGTDVVAGALCPPPPLPTDASILATTIKS